MPERLLDLGAGLELWRVPIDELIEQDVNARAMAKGMFDRLAGTVGRDQRLESLPLCALTARGVEIVSGHHRTRAARQAGLTEIHAIVDTTGLTSDQIKAKQLAHNRIQGEDNEELVKRIYESIGDVEKRLDTYIDPAALNLSLPKVSVGSIDLGLEHRSALIVFLPTEKDRFDRALEQLRPFLTGDIETVYLAERTQFEAFQSLTRRIGREYDIRSVGTTLAKVADIVLESLGEPPPESEGVVAARDVFGGALMPEEVAATVRRALDKASGDAKGRKGPRWDALQALADAYVDG